MKILALILLSIYFDFLAGTYLQLKVDERIHARNYNNGVGFILGVGEEKKIINQGDEEYYIKIFVY